MPKFIKDKSKSIGSIPGSLNFHGAQKVSETSIHLISFNENSLNEIVIQDINEAKKYIKPDRTTWINIYGLHDDVAMSKIAEYFSLGKLFMEDLMNTDHIPKYDEGENYHGFILKQISMDKSNNSIDYEQIALVIGENYVLTFQEKPQNMFFLLRERIRKSIGRITKKKEDYLFFAILDLIFDNYLQTTASFGVLIENLTQDVFLNSRKNLEVEIYKYKLEIGFLRMQVRPVKDIILKAIKSETSFVKSRNKAFYNDLVELTSQATETIELYNTSIADLLNLYNTQVSNRMNEVMKVLTVLSTIFIPLTFLSGVYGMNFENIPELSNPYGYFIFWGVILTVGIILFFYFKKKKWL